MPLRSRQQQKLMFATLNGAKTGVPKPVAEEFIKATPKFKFKKLKSLIKPL